MGKFNVFGDVRQLVRSARQIEAPSHQRLVPTQPRLGHRVDVIVERRK